MLARQLIAEKVAGGFRALPVLHGEWRKRMAARAIPSNLTIAEPDGKASVVFLGITRVAFPLRKPPMEPIVDAEGRATDYYVDWLNR